MDNLTTQKKAARICAMSAVMAMLLMPLQASVQGRVILHDVNNVSFMASNSSQYRPLSSYNATLYSQIFDAQKENANDKADILIGKLIDTRLMGHVLAQRYLETSHKPNISELKSWLGKYADHPQAEKIHALATQKAPRSFRNFKVPESGKVLARLREPTMKAAKIRTNPSQGDLSAKRATELFYTGKKAQAINLAIVASERFGTNAPQASWIAGLGLWGKGEFSKAVHHFEKAATSEYANAKLAASGAYWAARAYKKAGKNSKHRAFLKKAATHTHTFYGILAAHDLGEKAKLAWETPRFNRTRENMLLATRGGQRAFALIAAGQYELAQGELLRLDYNANTSLREAVMAYAAHIGLPSVAMRLAGYVSNQNGNPYDSALYPLSPWEPQGGYTIDPALVHALVRQESRFNPNALSSAGAHGLMQLMPSTAQYIAEKNGYDAQISAHAKPEVNLRLGQDYLTYLLAGSDVNGDLLSLLVAYNAGPGNLRKWKNRVTNDHHEDMLYFIETLPMRETREYVKNVMADYWIYRNRAGLPMPALAQISAGRPAYYADISVGFPASRLVMAQ